MASPKTTLSRAGTMELTAEEGIGFLKSAHRFTLLRLQGLFDNKPSIPRDNSMESTTKEAEHFLAGYKVHADAQTRYQQKRLTKPDSDESAEPVVTKKIKLTKCNTMTATANESKYIIGGRPTQFGKSRKETMKKRENAKLRKTMTIAKTIDDAKYVLCNNTPDVNEGRKTRSQSKNSIAAVSPISGLKRSSTMQKTASEGQEFLVRTRGRKMFSIYN